MIISFGWTTPALLDGAKTVTRREWSPATIRTAMRHFAEQRPIDAWNTSPRNKSLNPRKVAEIRLTHAPVEEFTAEAPPGDWFAEGFAYLAYTGKLVDGQTPEALWRQWHEEHRLLTVVRFEVIRYLEGPRAIR